MRFILTIIGIMLTLDAAWLVISVRVARFPVARLLVGLFGAAQIAGLIWLLTQRFLHTAATHVLAKFGFTLLFIWHLILLPTLLGLAVIVLPVLFIRTIFRLVRRYRTSSHPPQTAEAISRRQFLGTTIAMAPAVLNLSLATIAMRQLDQFRVRRFRLPLANLPRDLDGLTIAQVSDMHVGRFTSGRVLREIVRTVNELQTDLVFLTGDLINDSLGDLDQGFDLVRAMESRFGLYLIEGNHDLIENPAEFERRAKQSGIPFLLDESTIVSIRGAPVQLLGLSWTRARENRNVAIAASVHRLVSQRVAEAFPILLAHHPHAFDAASAAGMPLTLSGHTHGGQLMLNEAFGFGPALFRYWSGLYTHGSSHLIVSNGIGNWFPLRVRAPAELVHITLVRA